MYNKQNRNNNRKTNYNDYQKGYSKNKRYRKDSVDYEFLDRKRDHKYNKNQFSNFDHSQKRKKNYQNDEQEQQRKKQERLAKLRLLKFDKEYKDLLQPKEQEPKIQQNQNQKPTQKYIQEDINHEKIVDKLKQNLEQKIQNMENKKQDTKSELKSFKEFSENSIKFDQDKRSELDNKSLVYEDDDDPLDCFFNQIDQKVDQKGFEVQNGNMNVFDAKIQDGPQYITDDQLQEELINNNSKLKRRKYY